MDAAMGKKGFAQNKIDQIIMDVMVFPYIKMNQGDLQVMGVAPVERDRPGATGLYVRQPEQIVPGAERVVGLSAVTPTIVSMLAERAVRT